MLTTAIWLSGPFSPPPPSVTAVAVVGIVFGPVFILWARWIDRHRATQ
jgi:xanthosine utilization system XapX-like protein